VASSVISASEKLVYVDGGAAHVEKLGNFNTI
jgi:hypothetical protein